jgi:eukaryotic-like serine/threonine-protein kinase
MSSEDREGKQEHRLVTDSTEPPPPLVLDGRAPGSATVPVVPRSELKPTPAMSIAPPGASLGSYTGMMIDGRYRIGSILGEGGMGIVYRAKHAVIDKKVAVKILRSDFARQKEITDRFLQEARAASSIGNPHIIDISDFGQLPDGSTFFVMEYLDGKPLSTVIEQDGALPADRLIHIALQIADGLAAAHDRGIVHRDLKPENIFLIRRGSDIDFVKILDFGVAKVNQAVDSRITRAGTLFGTPHYMSPEQAAGTAVDLRADIYALGIIMYELACGHVPFDAEDLMGVLAQHMYKKPPSLRSIADGPPISAELDAIILKTLSKDAGQRYQTMQALTQDLDKLAAGETPDAVAEMVIRSASVFPASLFVQRGMPTPAPEAPALARRRPWGIYAGAAGILVAVCLVLAVLIQGSRSTAAVQTAGSAAASSANVLASANDRGPLDAPVLRPEAPETDAAGVLFAADPLDAHVFRHGKDLGATPLTIDVPKGEIVSVDVRHAGYKTQTVLLDGSERRMTIRLAPAGAPAAPGKPRTKKAWDKNSEIVNPWGR